MTPPFGDFDPKEFGLDDTGFDEGDSGDSDSTPSDTDSCHYARPHLINTMINVLDHEGKQLGTLLLILCDITETTIFLYGSGGFRHSHGREGTPEEVFRFMVKHFDVYESEFVGGFSCMLNIDPEVWEEAQGAESYIAKHFCNDQPEQTFAVSAILRFLRTSGDGECRLDAAMRRVFANIMEAQTPVLWHAFTHAADPDSETGLEKGSVVLTPFEQKILKFHSLMKTFEMLENFGIKEIEGKPIREIVDECVPVAMSLFPPGITPDMFDELRAKMDDLLDCSQIFPDSDTDTHDDFSDLPIP